MTARRRSSHFGWALFALFLAGLALRVIFVFAAGPSHVAGDYPPSQKLSGDALYYHEGANLLATGHGYIDPYRFLYGAREEVTLADGRVVTVITPQGHQEPTAGHPPFYVTYLAAFSTVGLDSLRAHQLASALLGAGSIVLAGLLGRSLVGERTGLVAAFLTAVYANIWINDALVMSETSAIFFAFLTSLVGLRFWRAPTLRNAIWFGLVGGAAALTRAELIFFLPIVAAVALIRAPLRWRTRLARYAVAGVVAVAVITPWVVRNNLVLKDRVFISDGTGTVLVQANCDATYYGQFIGYWNLACGAPQPHGPNGELLDESQRDVVVRQRAQTYISNHRTRLVTVVIPARIGRMWAVYEPFQQIRLDELEGRPAFAAWLGLYQFWVLAPLAAAGAVIQWRRRQPLLVVGLWAILATFTAATAFGNTRYRTAAEVTVVMLAAVTIDAVVGWLVARRRDGSAGEAVPAEPGGTPVDGPTPVGARS